MPAAPRDPTAQPPRAASLAEIPEAGGSPDDSIVWMHTSLTKAILKQPLQTHACNILYMLFAHLLTSRSEEIAQHGVRYSIRPLAQHMGLHNTQVSRAIDQLLKLGIVSKKKMPGEMRLWVIHPSKWVTPHETILPWVEHDNERRLILGPVPDEENCGYPEDCSYPQKNGSPQPVQRAGKRELPKGSAMSSILKDKLNSFKLRKNITLIEVIPLLLHCAYPGWRRSSEDITRPEVVAMMQTCLKFIGECQNRTDADIRMVLEYVAVNHEKIAAFDIAFMERATLRR